MNDPYQTNFVSKGQRNIFRQTWQRRADISTVKKAHINDRFMRKYTLDAFRLTNTASFDVPIDDITQNLEFDHVPIQGTPALPTCSGGSTSQAGAFYSCPTVSGLGFVNKTIGSPRQVQTSLRLQFQEDAKSVKNSQRWAGQPPRPVIPGRYLRSTRRDSCGRIRRAGKRTPRN